MQLFKFKRFLKKQSYACSFRTLGSEFLGRLPLPPWTFGSGIVWERSPSDFL